MNKYDREHAHNIAAYQKRVQDILDRYEKDITRLASAITSDGDKPFVFSDHPAVKARYERLIRELSAEMRVTIENGEKVEWGRADAKNDALAVGYTGSAANAALAGYLARNNEALEAFATRKVNGLDLSGRVWNITDQFSTEIQDAIGIGLNDNLTADELSREVRRLLKHPDMLFRRVRDEYGVLHLSKRAAAYHPGQGVYRSSYMNARRLAATEINMAYRTSDNMRREKLDFVVGIEVHLSNNHNCKGVPPGKFYDICDELQGKYPKDFKFTGWHPFCRCYTTTILKTREEMREDTRRRLKGWQPSKDSVNSVKDLPENFKKWLENNGERIQQAKSLPYFLKDNGKMEGDVWVPFQKVMPPVKPTSATTQVKEYTLKAKTIAEAELEISSRLGVTCNLKGFTKNDIKQVQDIFASAAENIDKFPELKDKIKFIGTMQGRKELMYNKFYDDFKKRYTGYSDDSIKKAARRYANREAPVESNTYAYSTPNTKFELNGVAFNANWKGEKVVKQLQRDVNAKFHPVKCDSVKAVFDHELGHKIDEALNLSKNTEFLDIFHEYEKFGAQYIQDNLSRYAYKQSYVSWNYDPKAEFIAECWSEYLNNPNPREISKKVGELIERLIDNKKAPKNGA
jgi:hypothetical protein